MSFFMTDTASMRQGMKIDENVENCPNPKKQYEFWDYNPKTQYVFGIYVIYIIFKLNGFSRNLRTELKRAKKFYFYDNGIRNAILQNFAPLALRQDVGALWENFFISERMKANQNAGRYVNSYFWRTSQQQEIDYLEECDGQFSLFEMKWNPKRANTKFPASFLSAYQVKDKCIVTPENWIDWVIE